MTRFALFLVLFFVLSPFSAQAQDITSGPRYRAMVRDLILSAPDVEPRFSFRTFRRVYGFTEDYDPVGDQARRGLLDAAYAVQTATDAQSEKEAVTAYEVQLYKHLAHVGVVAQAYALARQDKRFGSAPWLAQIMAGLRADVVRLGDGMSTNTPFEVINSDEEAIVLAHMGVKPVESRYSDVGGMVFHMHLVEDIKSQQLKTIFIDVSKPMRAIKRKENTRKPDDLNFKGGGF